MAFAAAAGVAGLAVGVPRGAGVAAEEQVPLRNAVSVFTVQ